MITIYQIHLSEYHISKANFQGFETVPEAYAKYNMMLGANKWEPEYMDYYVPTYEVDTDDLEQAFAATNLWDELQDGPAVRRLRQGHSSSVGDVFEKNGEFFVVDNFGFQPIEKPSEEMKLPF